MRKNNARKLKYNELTELRKRGISAFQDGQPSVCRLLNQLGLSLQKPLWRAFQQDHEPVEQWVKEEFPKIRALARKQEVHIFFGDEAGVRTDFHSGKTWAVRGKTPIVNTTGARFGYNMISAVSPRGVLRFMIIQQKLTADIFVAFLKRLIHNWSRSIFLIVYSHPVHKSVTVSKFVASTEGQLQLFYLPPYSPELNPDEQVWDHLKNHVIGKQPITGPDQLKQMTFSCLKKVQKLPSLIRSFFAIPETIYAGNC